MSLGFMIMFKFTYYQKQFHKYKLLEHCQKGHVMRTTIDFICITIRFMINL